MLGGAGRENKGGENSAPPVGLTRHQTLLSQLPSSIPYGPQFGPDWVRLVPSWAPFGPKWVPFGPHLGLIWAPFENAAWEDESCNWNRMRVWEGLLPIRKNRPSVADHRR